MRRDYGHDLLFGVFITPDAAQADLAVEVQRFAQEVAPAVREQVPA